MKKMTLLIALAFLAIQSNAQDKVKPINTSIDKPLLNEIATSEIGLAVISHESGFKYNAIRIINGHDVPMGFSSIKINNDDVFINVYNKKEFDLYKSPNQSLTGIALNRETNEMKVYSINAGVYFKKVKDTIQYEKIQIIVPNKNFIRREFIYNGKANNTLKFSYREFIEDLARPAFSQEIVYDLNESNIIGFRGMRIEVLKSSNVSIEYKVLSHFNK
jgi:hypothetical protein